MSIIRVLACVAGRREGGSKVKMSAGGRRYRDPPGSDLLALHSLARLSLSLAGYKSTY